MVLIHILIVTVCFFFFKITLLSLLLVVYPSPLISPLIFPPPLPSIPSSSPPFPFVTKKICRWVRNRAACTIHLGKQQYPSSYQHCGSPYAPQRFQTWKEKTQKRKAIVTNKNETNVCNLRTRMQVLKFSEIAKNYENRVFKFGVYYRYLHSLEGRAIK